MILFVYHGIYEYIDDNIDDKDKDKIYIYDRSNDKQKCHQLFQNNNTKTNPWTLILEFIKNNIYWEKENDFIELLNLLNQQKNLMYHECLQIENHQEKNEIHIIINSENIYFVLRKYIYMLVNQIKSILDKNINSNDYKQSSCKIIIRHYETEINIPINQESEPTDISVDQYQESYISYTGDIIKSELEQDMGGNLTLVLNKENLNTNKLIPLLLLLRQLTIDKISASGVLYKQPTINIRYDNQHKEISCEQDFKDTLKIIKNKMQFIIANNAIISEICEKYSKIYHLIEPKAIRNTELDNSIIDYGSVLPLEQMENYNDLYYDINSELIQSIKKPTNEQPIAEEERALITQEKLLEISTTYIVTAITNKITPLIEDLFNKILQDMINNEYDITYNIEPPEDNNYTYVAIIKMHNQRMHPHSIKAIKHLKSNKEDQTDVHNQIDNILADIEKQLNQSQTTIYNEIAHELYDKIILELAQIYSEYCMIQPKKILEKIKEYIGPKAIKPASKSK